MIRITQDARERLEHDIVRDRLTQQRAELVPWPAPVSLLGPTPTPRVIGPRNRTTDDPFH